jgi:hypothetical protein
MPKTRRLFSIPFFLLFVTFFSLVGQIKKLSSVHALVDPDNPISLSGDDFPTDPRIIDGPNVIERVLINSNVIDTNNRVYATTYHFNIPTADSRVLPIEDGYGRILKIYPKAGVEYEILAREVDIAEIGSYVETTLYGPDKKKIIDAGTRIDFTAAGTEPYYLIIRTFDHKTGDISVTVSNKNRRYKKKYIQVFGEDFIASPMHNYIKLGKKPVLSFIQFPQITHLSEQTINYRTESDRQQIENMLKRARVTQICPSNDQIVNDDLPVTLSKPNFSYDDVGEIANLLVQIRPTQTEAFPPGYKYIINLESQSEIVNSASNSGELNAQEVQETDEQVFSTINRNSWADTNNDGVVDISDYSVLVSEFMQNQPMPFADLDCDGQVDISDYSLLVQNFSL